MEFAERAAVRLQHWMSHNDAHQEEYGRFADQLEQAGKEASAEHVREMIELTKKSNDCLQKALRALEP